MFSLFIHINYDRQCSEILQAILRSLVRYIMKMDDGPKEHIIERVICSEIAKTQFAQLSLSNRKIGAVIDVCVFVKNSLCSCF